MAQRSNDFFTGGADAGDAAAGAGAASAAGAGSAAFLSSWPKTDGTGAQDMQARHTATKKADDHPRPRGRDETIATLDIDDSPGATTLPAHRGKTEAQPGTAGLRA